MQRKEKETFRRQRHHQSDDDWWWLMTDDDDWWWWLMMALTPKRLFLSLCISISLLRPYTFFSRSPLVFKTLFENACELQWVVLYLREGDRVRRVEHGTLTPLCSPAREALSLQERTSSKGWRQRSRTIGTCPTVKPLDGCAAEYPLRSFAPQSSACVEAAGKQGASIQPAIAAAQARING